MRSSLCEHLLDLSKSSLVDDQLLGVQDVVDVDEVGEGDQDCLLYTSSPTTTRAENFITRPPLTVLETRLR